jgi:hypothetical protein
MVAPDRVFPVIGRSLPSYMGVVQQIRRNSPHFCGKTLV